ncbi:MAG: right-handed parallel beta-helix repeat-containing protein, partial [Deltaproteobacteria bacterium]|nr:right-handed parallel beta-helix repeat-containing protein [Deltaproteobacteria bacterium]
MLSLWGLGLTVVGVGNSTATWTPDIPDADDYSVYAWWAASSNRATNAKYTVSYDGNSETFEVNQRIDGGKWNLLGTFPFAVGTSGYVQLSDDANGYVIADAIMFVKPPQAGEGDPAQGLGVIINSDSVTVDEGAEISTEREGFGSDHGPGQPSYSNNRSAGGSYGGMGGAGMNSGAAPTYGTMYEPLALGSGGGGIHAGRAGGALKLAVTNTLTINGSIDANGGVGLGDYAGGSGGSVWLTCGTLAGEGVVSADGGNYGGSYPGGGGGGRIHISRSAWTYTGTVTVSGGVGYNNGEDGTIYYDNPFLEWTGEANYTEDGLDPEWGKATVTTFTYRISYRHMYDKAPTAGYPKIHILKDDVEISGSPFTMSEVDGGDTDYDDGKLYTYPKIIGAKGDYTYYFSALAPNCGPGMGEGTVQQDAPSVAPLLVAKNQRTSVWYQEIQLALDAALSDDTIEVDTGVTYYEPSTINIPSGVTLVGDTDYPTYTRIKTVDVSPVISFPAASTGSALKGLTITSTTENLTRDATARNYFVEIGDGSSDITIEKCLVGRNDYVSGWSTSDSRFLATTKYNEGGIRIGTGSSNVTITNCKVRYLTGPGIAVEDGTNDNIVISNNYIYRNILPYDLRVAPIIEAPGVGLAGTARANITANLIYENNAGIGSHDLSGTDGTEGTLYIGSNTIRHNNRAGIGLNTQSTTYFKSAEIVG